MSIDPAYFVAIGALAISASSPLILAVMNRHTARVDRAADEAHRNEVAIEAANVATTLLESNRLVAQKASESVARTDDALHEIHETVNSNLQVAQARVTVLENQVAALIEELRIARAKDIISMLTDPEMAKDPVVVAKIISEIGRVARSETYESK
jgi:hypothetical protein